MLGAAIVASPGLMPRPPRASTRRRTGVDLRTRTAYHEAGHAVLSAAINDKPHRVSIRVAHGTVGLIVLFRELVRVPRRLLDGMARDSYAAYMLHLPVVVGLQAGAEGLALPVGVLFALVAVAAVLLAFGIGHLAGKTPGLRVILGMGP